MEIISAQFLGFEIVSAEIDCALRLSSLSDSELTLTEPTETSEAAVLSVSAEAGGAGWAAG